LIICGEEDPFQAMKFGDRLASDIPGAQLVHLQRARHFVMLDRPEIIAECLHQFHGPEGRVKPISRNAPVGGQEALVAPQFQLTEP
jgi:hypothetical protein